ncbi:DUF1738 domain-containing protein [Mucilaginibacter corticis]|uniref:DUF1738 domain-containing protein n=1 Tax=Mucilaginibacter corticis TaxID=2597670 RepID=A0A556MX57_9SPHI|nr:zincin-like metallopeptidase domain-containing protein [Mucilaginibacter corticis]TSJ44398.1 DUF1738 domain-containing protein [Mucilaginibacter corticis]
MSKNFKTLQEQVAEKLITALQDGTSPFQKPWTDDNSSGYQTPFNPTTGAKYRGMNALWLAMQAHQDPRWLTFKQAAANKWSVAKGSRATLITYVKKYDLRPLLDEKGKPVLDADGKPRKVQVKLDKPMFINALVFNGEQINGILPWQQDLNEEKAGHAWPAIERAEHIVRASAATIRHGGNEAYYAPSADRIQMPKQHQFDSAAKYYATLLHELGHWSGHETRLNRDLTNRYGTPGYAREELRAEIASLMIGSELNIGHNFGQHAAYVASWIKILKDDPGELFKASADAQRITDFIMEFERKQELSVEASKTTVGRLVDGDSITYKDTTYLVSGGAAKNTCYVQDSSGAKTKLNVRDGLYQSLLNARDNVPEQETQIEVVADPQFEARGYE